MPDIESIEKIKADLQIRSVGIPHLAWQRFCPDLQVQLGVYMDSPLLPRDKAHLEYDEGTPLPLPHTIGHDVVETFLDPEGRIMEKLVHYGSDGYDSNTRFPDELLGETSENRYRWGYGVALKKLDWLSRNALEL